MPKASPRKHSANSLKDLSPEYRKWIEEEVAYIATVEEKDAYLALQTDEERDRFITAFWESRNPNPSSQENAFKDEHYRRLTYANEHFGDPRYEDGWKSDQGRIYITLGAPQSIAKHPIGQNTRPVEIWFYQSPSPALPQYFSVVFYKERAFGDYILYSPRQDGPQKIVTDDMHSDAQALKQIQHIMGNEAEHAMLSLLPDEPIDVNNPSPTMASDILLDHIRALPDQPLEKARIAALREANREKVTSSLIFGRDLATLETTVLRDDAGRETVHFLLNTGAPDPRIVGGLPGGHTGYRVNLTTRVRGKNGAAIYQQEDVVSGVLPEAVVKGAQARTFGVEGRMPLIPGDYSIETLMVNELTHQGFSVMKTVHVPDVAPNTLGVSDLIVFRKPSPQQVSSPQVPFTMSQIRFAPQGVGTAEIKQGDQLQFAYQVWMPQSQKSAAPKKLHVHYVLGQVSATMAHPQAEDEDIDASNTDAAGNLLTGYKFDTSQLSTGTYRVVVQVSDPETKHTATTAMNLRIVPAEQNSGIWTAYGAPIDHPLWREELLRGIAYEAAGERKDAEMAYKASLTMQPAGNEAKAKLDALEKKPASQPSAKP